MPVRFVKISSAGPVAEYLALAISSHLRRRERVLWLVSGGSAIKVASMVAQKLVGEQLEHLTVSLTDERPGPVGHGDSNWRGLMEAGFKLPKAHLQQVLSEEGKGTKSETTDFNRFLREQLERNDFKVGLFGIGPDGHTNGLPATDAAPSEQLADYYEAGSFCRISSTPAAIARLDEAVAFVMGDNKHVQLDRFSQDMPYEQQSAQVLKLAPKVTIFNDYKGETL